MSEPNRARFAADPGGFAIRNETCPVVPGAAVGPDLFTVHEGKIYVFATSECVESFKDDPDAYLPLGRQASEG